VSLWTADPSRVIRSASAAKYFSGWNRACRG
jgi:hypothetical protein